MYWFTTSHTHTHTLPKLYGPNEEKKNRIKENKITNVETKFDCGWRIPWGWQYIHDSIVQSVEFVYVGETADRDLEHLWWCDQHLYAYISIHLAKLMTRFNCTQQRWLTEYTYENSCSEPWKECQPFANVKKKLESIKKI